jgi:hypothetical protein
LQFSPTAVELVSFHARANKLAIVLRWETATEIDNLGFNLYRADALEGPRTQLNAGLIPSQTPPGSPVGSVYKYRDRTFVRGVTHYYWLEAVDVYGHGEFYGPVSATMADYPLKSDPQVPQPFDSGR